MSIAAVIALIGAVGCLFLVRQKDFVPSVAPGEWSTPQPAGDGPASDGHGTPGSPGAPPATGPGTSGDTGPTQAADVHSG